MKLFLLFLLGAVGSALAYPRTYSYDYPRRRGYSSTYSGSSYNSLTSRKAREESSTKSDKENAKFAGASNQELDESNGDERTLLLKKKLKRLARPYLGGYGGYGGYGGFGGYGGYGGYGNPCSPFGRDAKGSQKDPDEQGRFLFDVNVYKVYPGGCRGYGGGGLGGLGGGGLLSDPVPQVPVPVPVPVRPYAPFATWLSLFAPGVLQAATVPGVPLADPIRPASAAGDLQSDPAVDPSYAAPPPVRRPVPNRVYYDSAGAPPVTPAQLVGGVATTVNGIIQQLTGQVQPVYQTGAYRSRSQRSNYG
ncbi:hypothetical protein KR067_004221 [Drosophila pandora]|nr:hypothetical protein KR067_004221 [Drosophila pandora]